MRSSFQAVNEICMVSYKVDLRCLGKTLGRSLTANAVYQKYINYREEVFPKLLDNPSIPPEDKQKIRELLKKPWNPYIRRHSALTEKSVILKENVLRQHTGLVGWFTNASDLPTLFWKRIQ